MAILRAITVCIFFLVIAPYLMGYLTCWKRSTLDDDGIVYLYIMGFLAELSVWWVMCVPYVFLFRKYPFHYLCNIYLAVTILLSTVGLADRLKRGRILNTHTIERVITISNMPYFLIFCFVAGVQFIRTIFVRSYEFSDEMAYAAGINDVVYLDELFMKSSMTGLIGDGTITIRRAIGTWYFYLANLSYYSGLHASFLCKVLIPTIVLILFYCVSYIIGKSIFRDEHDKQTIFMASVACVTEVFWLPNIRFYMVAYPVMWGKTTMAITAVPLILLYMQSIVSNENESGGLRIPFVLGCSAVNFTTGAFLFVSIEILLILYIVVFIRHIKSNKLLVCCVVCEVPMVIAMVLYMINKVGIIRGW